MSTELPLSQKLPGLFCSLLVVLAIGCGGAQTTGKGHDNQARDFALPDIEGRTVRLSDFLGQNVILVTFWATWCGPCLTEHPHLERIYRTYRDQGLVVLAISIDGPESVAEVVGHVRRYGLTFPVLLDEETRVVSMLNPKRAVPFALLISRDGAIVDTHEDYSPGDEVALEQQIRALLKPGFAVDNE